MCVQDVRLGRALAVRESNSVSPVNSVPVLGLSRDVNRGRAVFTAVGWRSDQFTRPYEIRSGGATGPVIASLTAAVSSAVLDVERYGPLVTDELWVDYVPAAGFAVHCVGLDWLQEVGEI